MRLDEPATIASSAPVEPAASIAETTGLTEAEAARRLAQHGENALAEKRVSPRAKLASYLWGPIPWMIEIAAVLSGLVQHWADFSIIFALLVLNAAVGFWQEFKADTAISALRQRLALKARVLRDGTWREVPAREFVPGDLVLIRLGNIVPADVRLVEGTYLTVDQSALTGESLPAEKKVGDIAYSGSIAKLGEMKSVVTAAASPDAGRRSRPTSLPAAPAPIERKARHEIEHPEHDIDRTEPQQQGGGGSQT